MDFSKMFLRRLKSEWTHILMDPPPLCYAEPNEENFFNWNSIIMGPNGTPYAGTALFLTLNATNYPYKPPKVQFVFPIFHPNVCDKTGEISVDILQSQWSPALKISKVLISIISILSDPLFEDIPFNAKAASMYKKDPTTYENTARNSCTNHFSDPKYQHLYFKFCFWQFGSPRKQLLNFFCEEREPSVNDLRYPNDELDFNLAFFEKRSFTFISSEIVIAYKSSKRLYELIKATENDIENWIKMMMESGNIEFVENNVEYRICGDLEDKQLWILYFQFLKAFNTKKLLQMYSLYCRFFPADFHILEEYTKAVEEFGPSFVPWKNPFDFEVYDENVQFAMFLPVTQTVTTFTSHEKNHPISCYFTSNNSSSQTFAFKSPLMSYILQNASPNVLQKLHMTCKYFFDRIPTPICYKLEIINEQYQVNPVKCRKNSIKIAKQIPQNSALKNLHLSKVLTVARNEDKSLLSKCLFNFYRCDAKYISITNQILTEIEIKFLICSKKVVEFELEKVVIYGNNGHGIMLEEILELTPKIREFRIDNTRCNSHTTQIICDLPFKNKIEVFYLYDLSDESLNPYLFAEFIEKNAAEKSTVSLEFLTTVNREYRKNFSEAVKNRINQIWVDRKDIPDLSILPVV